MATITYTIKNDEQGTKGYAINAGIKYSIKETANEWKLLNADGVKIELKWSKKEYPSFEEWIESLKSNGFDIVL